ncbi:solute carrier family 13 member 5-like protein [Dinothrombium tinctorium]|uniref:Solute carrier family 13 member 5-like protein n=1 Tax=Dinothrombium tinctorium TaxID=1965070 RepID=A0A3S3PEQ9_9ACAR|nr:solute carrier family 13 member 5-like protein [Dinothrombium tinctorium]RWS13778.1 solute carrier family 13 member 5-like protein [Dinothrombium tinctorium]
MGQFWKNVRLCWRTVILVVTPFLLSPFLIFGTDDCPIPMAVTSLLPIVLLPLLGLATTEEACTPYLQEPNMVFVGSLIFAIAVECSNLHKRIALWILQRVGTKFDILMLGFMLITMFIAMWIINTAAAAMMLPIADAVLEEVFPKTERRSTFPDIKVVSADFDQNENKLQDIMMVETSKISEVTFTNPNFSVTKLKKILYLSIAYSANIGGTSTLTSNGPNLVLRFVVEMKYGGKTPVDYTNWLFFAAPPAILSVLICWVLFKVLFLRKVAFPKGSIGAKNVIAAKYKELGPFSFHEKAICFLFISLVVLWMFRDPQFVRGWATYFGETPSLVNWPMIQTRLAWGVILLRGGGFAIANATQTSGLSAFMGDIFSKLSFMPFEAILAIFSIMSAFLTEFASNSATATIILPVAAQLATNLGINPLMVLIPVTLSCSYAFVLPVGTPANALVFEHAKLYPSDMILPGLITKFICLGVMFGTLFTIGFPIFSLHTFPDWAEAEKHP